MTKRVWHKGPPPHIGWFNASSMMSYKAWRWWDGVRWSRLAFEHEDAAEAGRQALRASAIDDLEWTDYYPANARVPRIDPRKKA